jgi:hypothetical protein
MVFIFLLGAIYYFGVLRSKPGRDGHHPGAGDRDARSPTLGLKGS